MRTPLLVPNSKPPRPWRGEVESVLASPERLAARVRTLARRIQRDFAGRNLVVAAVLKGTVCFLPDLVRNIALPLEIDFVGVSSYRAGTESGKLVVTRDLGINAQGRDVLVVDDILDTGRTLSWVVSMIRAKGARRVATCVLLDKPARRVVKIEADYAGFRIPDCFVVGYGLDHAEKYRNLPFVGALRTGASPD
jgi:hypoxanthine phosphoribosyltransferase